ncbi:MAG: 4Fe-4S dicluster domain-containing protein [Anaeromyxobacteraceae bacterium]
MTTTSAPTPARRFRSWRRLAFAVQALAVLGLPFLRVGGESAVRFDVPTLTLHLFGAAIWIDELFIVLVATLVAGAGFLLATLLFGRIWCGWACPQTALGELTSFLVRARKAGGAREAAALAAVAAVSIAAAANLMWYFVPPAEFFARAAGRSLGPVLGGAWATLAAVLFLDLAYVRGRFCATACPYAKLQGALLDRHSMIVAYDSRRAADCIDCKACVRVCPVGIDIRDGLQAACIACAECVDACQLIMRKLRRAPDLVGYFFGAPGTARRGGRPAVWALGALTAAGLALAVATGAARSPLDVTVSADPQFRPRRAASGETYDAFLVSLENRGRSALTLDLALALPMGTAEARPAEVVLAPGEHRRVRVVAVARGLDAARGTVRAELLASSRGDGRVRASRALTLAAPEAR